MSDDDIKRKIQTTRDKIQDLHKKGILQGENASNVNLSLQLESMEIQADIYEQEKILLDNAQKESKKAFIVGNISLTASLIALGIGIYTVLITVPLI